MSRAVTVSQINRYIANLFKQDYTLSGIQVKGEISGCKYHYLFHAEGCRSGNFLRDVFLSA